jgi:hypothetical protein
MTVDEILAAIEALSEWDRVRLAIRIAAKDDDGWSMLARWSRGAYAAVGADRYLTAQAEDAGRQIALAHVRMQRHAPKKDTPQRMRKVHAARRPNGDVDWKKAAKSLGIPLTDTKGMATLRASWRRFKRNHPEYL